MPLPAYHVGPGHLNGAAGKAEAAAFVPGRDGGGGEVEWSGNPVGEVSARAVAARHVRPSVVMKRLTEPSGMAETSPGV